MIRPASVALATLLTATLLLAGPAVAGATAPAWTAPQQLSTTGATGGQGRAVLAQDGRLVVSWHELDGSDERLRARVRDASGVWGDAVWISPSGHDVAREERLLANADGSVTLLWNFGNDYRAATLEPGESEWSDWRLIDAVPSTDGISGASVVSLADGSSALAYIRFHSGERDVILARRASGTATWTVDYTRPEGSLEIRTPVLSANESGDLVMAWEFEVASDEGVRAQRYTTVGNTWSGVTEPVGLTTYTGDVQAAIADDGTIVVSWIDGDPALDMSSQPTAENTLKATYAAPGGVSWSTPETLTPASGAAIIVSSLTPDDDNRVVAVYQQYDDMGEYYMPSPKSRAFDAEPATWDAPTALVEFGGAPFASRNAHGDVGVTFISSPDNGVTLQPGFAVRDSDTGNWDLRGIAPDTLINVQFGVPSGSVTDGGDGLVVYPHGVMGDPNTHTALVASDATGPRLSDVTVPEGADAGDEIDVSVNAFDLWSNVDTVSWDFGDGSGSETGTTAAHTYAAAGTYTVTVTASDINGHTSSTTRQVVVDPADAPAPPVVTPPAPPAPDDDEDTVVDDVKPPVITPPVLEVKLAGRTLTYNVKLTLKKGKSCSGKVQASFTYGNKRYRSNLKLKKVASACRATGKTTLKKTPSTRTKIKVKISGKQVKSRSLSSKRG